MFEITFDICSIGPTEDHNVFTVHKSTEEVFEYTKALVSLGKRIILVRPLDTTGPVV